MDRNTEKLARRTAEMEDALTGLTALFALLPLPGSMEEKTDGGLARRMGKINQVAEGLRAVDGAIAGAALDREEPVRNGAGPTKNSGTSDPGLYRETRALRRLSELMLRT